MMKRVKLTSLLLMVLLPAITFAKASRDDESILNFLNLKFGMFIHYNMGTYYAQQWAYPFNDPAAFTPSELDCEQWARAAKSAGMTYGVFTTKHHDGFCLWDSKTTNYDIASSNAPYRNIDIVKSYVDAFRNEGLTVGLYFSVWDRHQGVQHKNINDFNIEYTKQQLTELLTNYGDIACIVIDGWGSVWGKGPDFEELPYSTLADHIHSLQPECLVVNHSCRVDLSSTQIVHYEATHGQHIPYNNVYPSQQGPVIQPTWFWESGYENLELKPAAEIIDEIAYTNSHYSNYLLNCAPNDRGLMDENVIARLKEVGESLVLSPDLKSLPKIEPVHAGVKVNVSTAQQGRNLSAESVLDCNLFTAWRSEVGDQNPWIELNFGRPETFNYVSMHGGYGNRIQAHTLEAYVDGEWVKLYDGGEVMYTFAHHFDEVTARKYRLRVTEMKEFAELVELTFVKY